MARSKAWIMTPGEKLILAKSLENGLEPAAVMTGETPAVTVHELSGEAWVDVTSSKGFTVASKQVNASALTAEDGSTVPIGKAVTFTLTATETPGSYRVRVECDADDGTHPVADVPLTVTGTVTP